MTGKITSRAIGLDIGTSGIRAAELRHIRGSATCEVSRLAAVDLPHGTVCNGEVLDPKLFTKSLRSLWKKGRFTGRSVTFGISDTSIITRQLDLPWMPPDSFIQALPYQIHEALPVDISTVELDYHLLKQFPGRDSLGQETMINRILVVASNRASLTTEAQLIRKAGLTPICADSAAFALIRAACHGKIPDDERLRVIADIGAEQLTVVIHQNGQPRLIRTISNFGGDSATDAIVNLLDLGFDDAEKIKRTTGLNGPMQSITTIPESSVFRNISAKDAGSLDLTTQAVIKLLSPWATTLIKELRDSIDYFISSATGAAISDVTLCGGSSNLPGLKERISTELPFPVNMMDPLAGLPAAGRVEGQVPTDSTFAVAIGLALEVGK